jgi:hypothetical protein
LNKLDNLLTNLVRFCKKVYRSSKVIPWTFYTFQCGNAVLLCFRDI